MISLANARFSVSAHVKMFLLSDKEEQNIVTLQFVRHFGGSALLCLPLLKELTGYLQAATLQTACCLCIIVDV